MSNSNDLANLEQAGLQRPHWIMYPVAPTPLELVRAKLAEGGRKHPTRNMQVTVTEDELELRDRLADENKWTARETQVFALRVLDAALKDVKDS